MRDFRGVARDAERIYKASHAAQDAAKAKAKEALLAAQRAEAAGSSEQAAVREAAAGAGARAGAAAPEIDSLASRARAAAAVAEGIPPAGPSAPRADTAPAGSGSSSLTGKQPLPTSYGVGGAARVGEGKVGQPVGSTASGSGSSQRAQDPWAAPAHKAEQREGPQLR
jgi:hypothetical protein